MIHLGDEYRIAAYFEGVQSVRGRVWGELAAITTDRGHLVVVEPEFGTARMIRLR
jgi:hypothetical protein